MQAGNESVSQSDCSKLEYLAMASPLRGSRHRLISTPQPSRATLYDDLGFGSTVHALTAFKSFTIVPQCDLDAEIRVRQRQQKQRKDRGFDSINLLITGSERGRRLVAELRAKQGIVLRLGRQELFGVTVPNRKTEQGHLIKREEYLGKIVNPGKRSSIFKVFTDSDMYSVKPEQDRTVASACRCAPTAQSSLLCCCPGTNPDPSETENQYNVCIQPGNQVVGKVKFKYMEECNSYLDKVQIDVCDGDPQHRALTLAMALLLLLEEKSQLWDLLRASI